MICILYSAILTLANEQLRLLLRPPDYHDEPGDPEEVSLEEKKWIRRSLLGSVLAGMAWVTWIVVLQVLRDSVNPNWFVRGQDDADFTGW
jgi:hypothetical protein